MDLYKIIEIGLLISLLATQVVPKIRNRIYSTTKEDRVVKPSSWIGVVIIIIIIIIIIIVTAPPAY